MTMSENDTSTSGTERESAVMMIDIEQLIIEEAHDRDLDPKDLEVVRSKTSDGTTLVVQVEGRSLHTGTDQKGDDE